MKPHLTAAVSFSRLIHVLVNYEVIRRDRFTATAAQRSSEPRRGLPVNELVAAASNPNLFTQQAQGLKFKATHNQIGIQNNPAIRDSGYQSSTGSLPSSTQLHTNGPLPGPGMLPGSTVLPRNSSTGSTQYVLWCQCSQSHYLA